MEDAKKKTNNQDNLEEYDLDFLNDNLNINQEIDIQENPKKYQADQKKKQLLNEEKVFNSNKKDKNMKKNSVTYDDIFLCNEMFIARSKTFPKFKEKNNLISNLNNEQNDDQRNSFDDEEDCGNLRYNSFSYYDNLGDVNYLKKLITNLPKKINNNFKEKESQYEDEEETKYKNIYFIENNSELNNLSYYSKNNKCNYSFISLNLFIKKLCLENLKENFPILYKSFLSQYHEIFSLPLLVEKIIGAFHYYSTKLKIEIPDLVSLLNHIISYQYKKLRSNENLIKQLKEVYQEIETLSWIDENLKKEIENVNYILSEETNEDDDFDVDYTKYLVSDRKRTRGIQIKSKGRAMKPVVGVKKNNKIPYFYIFDFSNEEIAKNLTLISYKLISSINYNELWNCNFSKENKNETAPNIMKIIERSDKLTLFIIEDVCGYSDPKIRANAISKWAEVADTCRELHNFSDLLTINNCLNRSCIKKLVKTWKKLPKNIIALLSDLNKFCSKQQCYVNIRKAIANCKHLAYIPYIGILLEEIVDIEKKYDYFLCDTNFSCIKIQKIYFAVTKFFEFKNYSFTFMQLNDLNVLSNINPKSKEEINELISQVEPKYKVKTSLPFGYKKRPTKTDQTFY